MNLRPLERKEPLLVNGSLGRTFGCRDLRDEKIQGCTPRGEASIEPLDGRDMTFGGPLDQDSHTRRHSRSWRSRKYANIPS